MAVNGQLYNNIYKSRRSHYQESDDIDSRFSDEFRKNITRVLNDDTIILNTIMPVDDPRFADLAKAIDTYHNDKEISEKKRKELGRKIKQNFIKTEFLRYRNTISFVKSQNIKNTIENAKSVTWLANITPERKQRWDKRSDFTLEKILFGNKKLQGPIYNAAELNNNQHDFDVAAKVSRDEALEIAPVIRGISQKVTETLASIDNVMNNSYDYKGLPTDKKHHLFMDYDTETFGGQDRFGRQQWNKVSEFSFKLFELSKEPITINGKESHIAEVDDFSTVIGFTNNEYNDVMSSINKANSHQQLTSSDRVNINRAARYGHEKSVKGLKEVENGIFRYDAFAGSEDLAADNILDYAAKGAEALRNIGKKQKSYGATEIFHNTKMFAWEKKLFSALDVIYNNGNQLSVVGHNIRSFDSHAMMQLFTHGLWSKGAIKLWNDIYKPIFVQKGNIKFGKEADTLAIEKMLGSTDRFAEFRDKNGNLDPKKVSEGKKIGTLLQQETIQRAAGTDSYDNGTAAHLAATDVKSNAELFAHHVLSGDYEEYVRENKEKRNIDILKGGQQNILFFKRGSNGIFDGLLFASTDTLSGNIISNEDVEIDRATGKISEKKFSTPFIHSGMTYTIDDISKIPLGGNDSELRKAFRERDQRLDSDELMRVVFSPVSSSKEEWNERTTRKITVFGPQEMIENWISQNALKVGNRTDKDKATDFIDSEGRSWNETMDDETRKELTIHYYGENGKFVGEENPRLKDLVERSTVKAKNEGAARAFRQHDVKKDIGQLQFINDAIAFANERGNAIHDAYELAKHPEIIKDYAKKVYENTKIAMAQIDAGGSYQSVEVSEAFQHSNFRYFGYLYSDTKNSSKTPHVYDITASNAVGRIIHSAKNYGIISRAVSRSLDSAGMDGSADGIMKYKTYGSKNKELERNYSYYINGILDSLKSRDLMGRDSFPDNNLGKKNVGVYAFNDDKFEINFPGYADKNTGNPLRIDIGKGATGYGIANKILRMQGKKQDIRDVDKVKVLATFMSDLGKSPMLNDDRFDKVKRDMLGGQYTIDINSSNLDFEGEKVLAVLRDIDRIDSRIAHLTESKEQILDLTKENAGLSGRDIESTLNMLDNNRPHVNTIRDPKEKARSLSKSIVDDVVYGGKKFDDYVDDLKKRGYTKEQITKLRIKYNMTRQDYYSFFDTFTKNALQNGVNFNITEGKLFYGTNPDNMHEVTKIMHEGYMNGLFYGDTGSQRIIHVMGIYSSKGKYRVERDKKLERETGKPFNADTAVMTEVGYIANDKNGLVKWKLNNAVDEGTLEDTVDYLIRDFTNTIGQGLSSSGFGVQDVNRQFDFNYKGILYDLVEFRDKGLLDNLPEHPDADKSSAMELLKIIDGLADPSKSSKTHKAIIDPDGFVNGRTRFILTQNIGAILDATRRYYSDSDTVIDNRKKSIDAKDYDILLNGVNPNIKSAKDFNVSTTSIHESVGEGFTSIKRGIGSALGQATRVLESDVPNVKYGRALETKLASSIENTDAGIYKDKAHIALRVGRLKMDSGTFGAIAENMFAQSKKTYEDRAVLDLLEATHLDEGASIASPKLIDNYFGTRDSSQKTRISSVASIKDGRLIKSRLLNELVPNIDFDLNEQNKIKFSYGNGIYTSTTETAEPLLKQNVDGSITEIPFKRQGVSRIVYFDRYTGIAVSEGTVKDVLQKNINIINESAANKKGLTVKEMQDYVLNATASTQFEKQQEINNLRREAAYDLLDKAFDGYIYNVAMKSGSTPKLTEYADKGEYHGIYSRIGQLDERVRKFFDSMGLHDFTEGVLDISYIESIDKGSSSIFSSLAMGIRKEHNNPVLNYSREFNEALKESGFASATELKEAIIKERYRPWEKLMGELEKIGISKELADKTMIISDHDEGIKKHADFLYTGEHIVNNLLEKLGPEATKKALIDYKVFRDNAGDPLNDIKITKSGTLEIDENAVSNIDIAALTKLANDNNLSEGTKKPFYAIKNPSEAPDNVKTFIDENEYNRLSKEEQARYAIRSASFGVVEVTKNHHFDANRMSDAEQGKKMHFNFRAETLMNLRGYDEKNIALMNESLNASLGSERADLLRRELGIDSALAGKGEYSYTLGNLTSQIWSKESEKHDSKIAVKVFNNDGNEVIDWFTGDETHDVAFIEKLRRASYNDSEIERMRNASSRLEDIGISKNVQYKLLDVASKSNAPFITESAIKNAFSIMSYEEANKINKFGIESFDADKIKAYGFDKNKIISIEDIIGSGINNNKLAPETPKEEINTLMQKGQIVDMHLDFLGDHQIYDTKTNKGRYIALPWANADLIDEFDYSKTETQQAAIRMSKRVAEIRRKLSKMQNGTQQATLSEDEQIKTADYLKGQYDIINQSISDAVFAKRKILANFAEAELNTSGFFTAYGHQLKGNEQGFFGNISFAGIKLKDEAAKDNGLEIDYQVFSHEARNKWYGNKYWKSLGLDKEAMSEVRKATFKNLETTGTLSLNIRNPQGYIKSTSVAVAYSSNAVNDNELLVSAGMWESKKGDYDSDEASMHVLKGNAFITSTKGKTTQASIDYATYNALMTAKEKGIIQDIRIGRKTRAMFTELRRGIIFDAATTNKNNRSNAWKLEHGSEANKDHLKDEFDTSHLMKQTLQGEDYKGEAFLSSEAKFSHMSNSQKMAMVNQYANDSSNAIDDYRANGSMFIDKNGKSAKIEWADLSESQKRTVHQRYIDKTYESGSKERLQAQNAAEFIFIKARSNQDRVAAMRKGAAGEMNNIAFKMLRIANATGQFSHTELEAATAIHTALNEAFLSPKNERGVGNINLIDDMKTALNDAYRIMANPASTSSSRAKEVINNLGEQINNVLQERRNKEIRKIAISTGHIGEDDKVTKEYTKKLAYGFAQKLVTSKLPGGKDIEAEYGVGVKLNSGDRRMIAAYTKMDNMSQGNMLGYAIRSIQEAGRNINGSELFIERNQRVPRETNGLDDLETRVEQSKQFDKRIASYKEALTRGETKRPRQSVPHAPTLGSAAKSIADAISSIHISKGTAAKIGAGIAGSLMVSGYANGVYNKMTGGRGGHDPGPADQAAGSAESESLNETYVPQLSDGNVGVMRGGPSSGYVININANSPQGQSVAQNAIQEAVGAAVPLDSTINITMNTSYKDQLNQLQVGRILASMI